MIEIALMAIAAIASFLYGSVAVKLATIACVLGAWWQMRRPAGIPPGPRGVPIFGYLPFMGKSPCLVLKKLAKKYGNIYSLYLGDQLTIVLYDYASAKKALIDNGDLFSGRPEGTVGKIKDGDENCVLMTDGPMWKEHRRFALSTLRDYGIGKSSIEPQLLDEIQHFLDIVADKKGEAFDINYWLGSSVCNNICILEFGKRFDYTDQRFLSMKKDIDDAFARQGDIQIVQQFPFLKKMPGRHLIHEFDTVVRVIDSIDAFCTVLINEHRENYVPGNKSDYIDAYVTEKAHRQETNNYPELFNDIALLVNLRIFFLAGTETTTTTLRWALLYMMLHPDIQRKVQKEIDDVIGRERAPSAEDRLNMPFTDAVIMETLRRGNPVGMNLPHSNLEATELEGYHIPKRTMILTDLYGIHHDEKLFPDPMSYRPERHINEHGKVIRSEHIVPFSFGKRLCLGEPLARIEVFLFFTCMLQKFTFKKPEGEVLSTETDIGFTNTPRPYKLIAELRT